MDGIDSDKGYPSKISSVYPEGSLEQLLAVHAFNFLAFHLEGNEKELKKLAIEFGVTVDQISESLERLYTEN